MPTADTHTLLMATETGPGGSDLAGLRLLQLVSPALPVGGFTYSQGLEWAVEAGWVSDAASLDSWLGGLLDDGLTYLDLPLLIRLRAAYEVSDRDAARHWGQCLLAARESAELRAEELNRSRALLSLLADLGIADALSWKEALMHSQLGPFALASVHWGIPLRESLLGYAWSWLENQVTAAIKLVPLGQTEGQRALLRLAGRLPHAVTLALQIDDDDIGAAAPAMAIASARHETQYTRLFRS